MPAGYRKRAKTGCAISSAGRTGAARRRLVRFIKERLKTGDLDGWRRGRTVLGYIEGRRVVELAKEADVALIEERFGVRYHNHHVPRLLHDLGFSVQRPRKRLAKADVEAQAQWLRKKLPAIKKARRCGGFVMFEDEASFWLDGTLHRTWARVGQQPHVDTFGQRKTAHVFGVVTLEDRPR